MVNDGEVGSAESKSQKKKKIFEKKPLKLKNSVKSRYPLAQVFVFLAGLRWYIYFNTPKVNVCCLLHT